MLTVGIFSGLLLGQFVDLGGILNPVIISGLFILILISMMKINLFEFAKDFRRAKFISLLAVNKLLILPLVAFLLGQFLPPEYLPGLILMSAVPAAMATPALLILLKGDPKVGLAVSILTNLLVPFSMPLVFKYTIGTEIDFDLFSMFSFLFAMVFGPFVLALILEYFTPKLCKKVIKHASGIISIDIFIFTMVAVAPYSKAIVANPTAALISFAVVVGTSLFFHLFAALPYIKAKREDMVASIIVMAYANTGLGIVIAIQYFDTTTVLLTVLYEVVWSMGMIPMQMFFAKKGAEGYNLPD